jgi:hypothetical protein
MNANNGTLYITTIYIHTIYIITICGPRQRTRYSDSLRAGLSGDRIPVEARFFATFKTGPWLQPTSYTVGTKSFPGDKAAGAWPLPPTPSSVEIK